jgi:hypothetical protein
MERARPSRGAEKCSIGRRIRSPVTTCAVNDGATTKATSRLAQSIRTQAICSPGLLVRLKCKRRAKRTGLCL